MNVCESLKAIIKGRGITYTHLSRETGIPIDAISSSLNGKRNLKADEFIAICSAAGINMQSFRKNLNKPPKASSRLN